MRKTLRKYFQQFQPWQENKYEVVPEAIFFGLTVGPLIYFGIGITWLFKKVGFFVLTPIASWLSKQ